MLGDHLLDAYRAFVLEVYDTLAAEGFPDLPQAATTVFRDIDGRGSWIADLAAQAGYTQPMMRLVLEDLERAGYVEVDGDTVRPAPRGDAAFAAGRRALATVEERWERRLGHERFEVFRSVVREMSAQSPFA
jgi:hypothetical protein